ncbi:MAG: lysophospholipase [Actinomycetales bacterium]|nr:MAG: lysophospholipase [Actinomycetales bacterium]
MTRSRFNLPGHAGQLAAYRWGGDETAGGAAPAYAVLLVHGYGEHMGRYDELADRLVADGAVVYGVDHVGHGHSDGERVLITDFEPVVDDVRRLREHVVTQHPGLPVVMIGHSMGGLIATRYAQRHAEDLLALVLSAPVLGNWAALEQLLALDELPDTPIDPAVLSRDLSVGEAYAADPLVWHGPFKRPTLEALQATLRTVDNGGPLALPALWLHGEQDELVPYDGTAAGWERITSAGAEAGTYAGARHEIFNETNKREVVDDVLAFLHRQRQLAAEAAAR